MALKTDFDDSIGLVEIVPQDIGRVVLNLLNNTFYACTKRNRSASAEGRSITSHEHSRSTSPEHSRSTAPESNLSNNSDQNQEANKSYGPTVSVSTKLIGDSIEIRIGDNGNGIPQAVLDKVFQPFFTTKPAGQGTGLGLSLSYDIAEAHGGSLNVETAEGEGSVFIIELPVA